MKVIASLMRPTSRATLLRVLLILFILGVVASVVGLVTTRRSGQASLDVALEQLEDVVRRNPQDAQARLAVGIAYIARGYNDSAIEQFQEVLKLEENNQTALMGLGRTHLQKDELDKALAPLLKVVELNKDNPRRRTLDQLEAVYYDLGLIYVRKKDYPKAVEYLAEALEINSTDADAWFVLGRAQQEGGDYENALTSYSRAVDFVPDFVDAYKNMADIYEKLGRAGEKGYATGMIHLATRSFDKASKDLQEATRAVPSLPEAHEGLGIALEAQGRTQEALASYRRALELDPDLMLARLALQRLGASER